jgi:hypothetical protein
VFPTAWPKPQFMPILILSCNTALGAFGTYYENVWMHASEPCTNDKQEIIIPLSDDIRRYIILLRRKKEQDKYDGWKYVIQVTSDKAKRSRETPIVVPELTSLPLLADREDADDLLKKSHEAPQLVKRLNKSR